MKRALVTLLSIFWAVEFAYADFSGPAITVVAKYNAAGVVLNCISRSAVIEGYKAAGDGNLDEARKAGCVEIPDGAVVMVDCEKTDRNFARIKYKGRAGWTSYEQLSKDCRH